jgi:hypothetical protein
MTKAAGVNSAAFLLPNRISNRRNKNWMRRLSRCVLVLLAVVAIYSQQRDENVFKSVPLESRPRLVERLREYVTYERTRRYEKVYDLLYERNEKNAGKDVYSKSRVEAEARWGVIQEFTPTSILNITLNEGDAPTFSVTGQAKVLLKGRTVKKEMRLSARLQDGEWYFSELLNSYLHID